MSNLETACLLSCERWADTFEKEIPEHTFSKEHNEKMKPLLSDNLIKYKPKLSKKTLKFILIAAIILSLAITVFVTAKPLSSRYKMSKGKGCATYNVTEESEIKNVKSLNVNYIPEGFELTEKSTSINAFTYKYEKGNEFFIVDKWILNANITYDTERTTSETVKVNGRDVILWRSENNIKDYLYNDGEYVYIISGNISENELVKILQNAK